MWFLRHRRPYYKQRSAEITRQQKNWQIERKNIQRENKIKNEYNNLKNKNPFHITTGKLALWLLLCLCLGIIIFTAFVTMKELALAAILGVMPDFTPLSTMIGAIIAAALDVAAYFAKSAKENSVGGITYEAAAAKDFQKDDTEYPVG